MVVEIDGYKERMKRISKLDLHSRIAEEFFPAPKYCAERKDGWIDINVDLMPGSKEVRHLPRAVTISERCILVYLDSEYKNARKYAERLEKEIGEEVELKTGYKRS